MLNKEVDTYSPQNQKDWRQWLKKNHRSKQSVWVVYYTKRSKIPSISWSEAVDEALCFGWIDSTKKRIDDSSFMQLFSKRKLKSNWSKINKEKIKKLIDSKRMAKAGFESIEIAKQNGSWTILDEVEELILPNDLEEALEKYKGSKDYFLSLSKSTRKLMLGRIALAKRPETRQKRVQEVVENARQKSLQIN
ncbi:YdeI/OmpD-associated family protein [Ravibacter arvi]|uniref:YdeI/OmpD-associated family protein n=1 Tax=Ravibacter arvi TaxID=2051041 RepID=A0ABP8M8S1_9BACT